MFHSLQLIASIAYFLTSLKDPGYISFKQHNLNHSEEEQLMLDIINHSDHEFNHDPNINNNNDLNSIQYGTENISGTKPK